MEYLCVEGKYTRLARSAPSPLRGEGWGEGGPTLNRRSSPPHPNPLGGSTAPGGEREQTAFVAPSSNHTKKQSLHRAALAQLPNFIRRISELAENLIRVLGKLRCTHRKLAWRATERERLTRQRHFMPVDRNDRLRELHMFGLRIVIRLFNSVDRPARHFRGLQLGH